MLVGSDLAGETAAALTAASMLFKDKDPGYSAECLDHAKKLYNFANTYRGKYSDCAAFSDAREFYQWVSVYQHVLGTIWNAINHYDTFFLFCKLYVYIVRWLYYTEKRKNEVLSKNKGNEKKSIQSGTKLKMGKI